MPGIGDDFSQVLKDFKKRLSPEEESKFAATSLSGLKVELERLQNDARKNKIVRNLPRIQPFLQAMAQYQTVIEVFLNTSDILCFVWGPLKFILLITNNLYKAFDVILDTYAELAESFPLMLKYQALFDTNDYMRKILVWIFEDILKFHLQAYRIISRTTLQKIFNAAWNDFQASTKATLNNLARHRELLDRASGLTHIENMQDLTQKWIQESRDARTQAQAALDELLQQQAGYRRQAVVSWLTAANVRADQDYFAKKRRHDDKSGQWLLEDVKLKQWLDVNVVSEPLFWLHGIPGAGKTILTSVLIAHALSTIQNASCSVSYFYCKEQDTNRSTFASIAKSIICQLLEQNDDLLSYLYGQCLKLHQVNLTSQSDCTEILNTILEDSKNMFIIIDGIDECERRERKALLNFFTSAVSRSEEVTPGRVRIFFASQELSDIKTALSIYENLHLTKAHSKIDVENYIHRVADEIQSKFEGMPDEARRYIIKLVCDGSEGMFLFAKLVLKNLKSQENLQDLYNELKPDIFPHGFEQAYSRIVKRIFEDRNPVKQRIARRVLGWVTCAKRPLLWREIRCASAIHVTQGIVDFESRQLTSEIREICGSLIDVLPGDRIQLVHTTARHYLYHHKYLFESSEDRALALLCLQYLTFECFTMDTPENAFKEFTLKGYYGLLDYASLHWRDHLIYAVESLKLYDLQPQSPLELAINDFVEIHCHDKAEGEKLDQELSNKCISFKTSDCHDTVLGLLSVSKLKRASSNQLEALGSLGIIIDRVRRKLQDLIVSSELEAAAKKKLEEYYGFPKASVLAQHISRHEKPFCCTEIGCTREQIGWATEKELKKHMNQYHPDPASLAFKFPHVKKLPAVFRCETCDKSFGKAHSLKIHNQRAHLKENNHECDICGKGFVRKYECDRHRKTHNLNGAGSSQDSGLSSFSTPPVR